MNNILITGASGYIGKHLARYLAQSGHTITAVMRHEDQDVWLNHPNIKRLVVPEITDESDALFEGIEIVIHAAGRAHKRGKKGEAQAALFRRDNVDFALNVARCAQRNGARRMIFLSSIGAALLENDLSQSGKTLNQAWSASPYRASKLTAERELASLAKKTTAFDIVSLRLPMVYGKDAPGNFRALSRAIQKRIPMPFASIHNKRAFASIGTVCDFVAHCLNHPKAAGVWALRDADEVSTPDFVRAIAETRGYPPPRLCPFPTGLIRLAGHVLGLQQTIESLINSLHIDLAPLQENLGWAPKDNVKTSMGNSFKVQE